MISSQDILNAAARSYGLTPSDLIGSRMLRSHSRARLLAIALFRAFRPTLPSSRIANVLKKDASSVCHLVRDLERYFSQDEVLVKRFAAACAALRSGREVERPTVLKKVDRRFRVQTVSPSVDADDPSEDFSGRVALKNSENRLLLALRRAHPELECQSFSSQGQTAR